MDKQTKVALAGVLVTLIGTGAALFAAFPPVEIPEIARLWLGIGGASVVVLGTTALALLFVPTWLSVTVQALARALRFIPRVRMRLPFYLRTGKAEATARAVLLERDAYEAKELDAIRETTKKVEELIEIFESIPDDTVPPSGRLWKEHYKWRLDQLLRERQELPKESGKEYGALLEDLLERYTMRLPAVEHRETIRALLNFEWVEAGRAGCLHS